MTHIIAECVPNTEIREVAWPADRALGDRGTMFRICPQIQAATGWVPTGQIS